MSEYVYIKVNGTTAIIQAYDGKYVHLWLKESLVFSLYVDFSTGEFSTNDKINKEIFNEFTSNLDCEAIKLSVDFAFESKNRNEKLLNKYWMDLWISTPSNIQKVIQIGNKTIDDLVVLGTVNDECIWGSKNPSRDEIGKVLSKKHELGLYVSDENRFFEVACISQRRRDADEFIRKNEDTALFASSDKFHFVADVYSC